MSWAELHRQSQEVAIAASEAKRRGESDRATHLYSEAAGLESAAFRELDSSKPRTLGITAISAVALWYKADDLKMAERQAHASIAHEGMPEFAQVELRSLLQAIWNSEARSQSTLSFAPGQVLVSVRGGEVVTGGAPLELILSKALVVQNMLFRTAEYLNKLPLRRRGPASPAVQAGYRPWIFQSVPGSYQFAVSIERQAQAELFPLHEVEPERVTGTFLQIMRASSEDPVSALPEVVGDEAYQKAFLRLVRSLTPNGRSSDAIEFRRSGDDNPVILTGRTRSHLSEVIAPPMLTKVTQAFPTEIAITGILRALHLEHDWLEIIDSDGQVHHVEGVSEVVDDAIGPMVNHVVVVRVSPGRRNKSRFIDIDLAPDT